MPIKCYNKDCHDWEESNSGLDAANHCCKYGDVSECHNAINCTTTSKKEQQMSIKTTLALLMEVKGLCIRNLKDLQQQEDKTVGEKPSKEQLATEYGSIIKSIGACSGGTEGIRQLVEKLTGLDIPQELVRRPTSSKFDLPELVVYVPTVTQMDVTINVPHLHLSGKKFLATTGKLRTAYYPKIANFQLATEKQINLLFKALEVQLELGTKLSKYAETYLSEYIKEAN